NIESFFLKKGCKTLCLPIITNTEDYSFHPREKNNEILNLVYPGNPDKKDSLIDMLKGISLLNDVEKKQVRFHMTGVSEAKVRSILGKEASILDSLKENVIIHSWMDYTELMNLFSEMNLLLLARPVNKVTISNFPSKVPELLACGIAPIAVRVGDYHKYLDDGKNAILYEGCRPEDIKESILRALKLTNKELNEMSSQARLCAETVFDYRIWADKLDNIIMEKHEI
ncbi:glycosyltransferase, partial [Priestia megaterium]